MKKIIKLSSKQNRDFYIFLIPYPFVHDIDSITLFNYLNNNGIKSIIIVDIRYKKESPPSNWLFFDFENFTIEKFVFRFFKYLKNCRYIVFSYFSIEILKHLKKLSLKTVFIPHGMTFFKDSIFQIGYIDKNYIDYLCISNDFEMHLFTKDGWDESRLIKSGQPRLDLWQKNKSADNIIFLFFTWRRHLHSFEEFSNSSYYKNIKNLLTSLERIFTPHGIKIAFAFHHMLPQNKPHDISPNIIHVETKKISNYVSQAKMLITDYSAVSFDFMFQNKPVIFYFPDSSQDLISEEDICDRKLFYKREKYFLNDIATSPNDIYEIIYKYLGKNFEIEEVRKNKNSLFFYYNKNICEKITEKLQKVESSYDRL